MGQTYRRFSTEFELQQVEAYLAGAGSINGIANGAGIEHSLLHYWIGKYRAGELSLDVVREETLIADPAMNNARSVITSGPAASAPGEDAS